MSAKLNVGAAKLNAGRTGTARNQLNGFVLGQSLIKAANSIKAQAAGAGGYALKENPLDLRQMLIGLSQTAN